MSSPASDDARPDGRKQRWAQHRENRRRELVAAVVAAVRSRGADVSMEGIVAESGVAKQVFYRYFHDKADLQLTVGRALARNVVADVGAAIAAQPTPRAALAAGIERYIRLIENEPELYRYVVTAPANAGPHGPVEDFSAVIGLQAAHLIGDRLRETGRDAGAAEPWAFALVGSIRAAADRWLSAPSMSREALCGYLTDFAWSGLSTQLSG